MDERTREEHEEIEEVKSNSGCLLFFFIVGIAFVWFICTNSGVYIM